MELQSWENHLWMRNYLELPDGTSVFCSFESEEIDRISETELGGIFASTRDQHVDECEPSSLTTNRTYKCIVMK